MTEWRINPNADNETAYAVLATDRIWNSYSICNLDEPLRQHTRVALASKRSKREAAACVILQHPDFSALVTHGDAGGVAVLLHVYDDLPALPVVLARQSHLPAIETQFHFATTRYAMIRMVADRTSFRPSTGGVIRAK